MECLQCHIQSVVAGIAAAALLAIASPCNAASHGFSGVWVWFRWIIFMHGGEHECACVSHVCAPKGCWFVCVDVIGYVFLCKQSC